MKTLFMTRGLPASGKSTAARSLLASYGPGHAHRVSKDDLRAMLDDGKWSRDNEKFVLSVRDHIVASTLDSGCHVIVDDTNLAPKHEARLRQLAKEHDAKFEVLDFSHVSVDVCIERDRKRPNYVGERVIKDMYEQFLMPKVDPPARDPNLPPCVIVDVDGTVALMNGRSPFEWDKVGTDTPRENVLRLVRSGFHNWAEIIFMSGRDEGCRQVTKEWLDYNYTDDYCLYMRPAGDMRKDAIVKRELYEKHIAGKFNVEAIFDDRPAVIRMWRELGFTDRIFDVGTGKEF